MNEEIQNLMQTYQRSLNEADVDLVGSVYADDAIFIGQPFPTATGIEEILALPANNQRPTLVIGLFTKARVDCSRTSF